MLKDQSIFSTSMISKPLPALNAATFADAFERFCAKVLTETGVGFENFETGYPFDREGYKEWVYHNGRIQLNLNNWKSSNIGSGLILQSTINAIELHKNSQYRNNLIQWDARFGLEARAHRRLIADQGEKASTKKAEQVLFDLFCGAKDDEQAFKSLVEIAGKRYELITYLLFLKDWTRYMPVRPTAFSEAFEQLGVPHAMSGKCSWDNYSEYLVRLQAVQCELAAYGIPGIRLIDAHSFCWILAGLARSKATTTEPANWLNSSPQNAFLETKEPAALEVGSPVDYAAVEAANRCLGTLAQLRVLNAEVWRLKKAGCGHLARKVEDVSLNGSLGYDIRSFQEDGSPKLIEVKAAANRGGGWRFFLTENERAKSLQLPGYVFALVQHVESTKPTIWEFPGAQLPSDSIRPVNYEVRITSK